MAKISNEEFVLLIHEYKTNMYRLALGMLHHEQDAEDVVCESVLNAYIHIHGLKSTEKFKPWIMQITANEAKKCYKKSKKTEMVPDIEIYQCAHQDDYHELWDIVMKLDVSYREVIILYFYDQLQIKEISHVLKIAEGTVKSRLFRAKKLLKDMI